MPKKIKAEEKSNVIELNSDWKFKTDKSEEGINLKWFLPDFQDQSWSTVTVPAFWESSGVKDYDGIAWYRTKVSPGSFTNGERIVLSFGAVDDECTVWFNGEKLGEHKGWNEPFYFDVTDLLKKNSENIITVRVHDWGWDGGIWKPVSLRTFTNEDDLLKGEYFDRPALQSADWVKDAVLYEVYLRSFSDDSKFTSLESRLSELKSLGVTCLWLMPINPVGNIKRKGSLGSPYSVKDYYGINLEFGTKDGFRSLVEEAHLLGLKIIIDWVANHTAWDNPLIKNNPEWFMKNKVGEIIPPNEHWSDVAGLDYNNKDLRKYMRDVLIYWVKEFNIDGYRCDVADMLPVDFWEEVRKDLLKIKPGILMLAEGDRPENHLASFDLTYAWNINDALLDIVKGKADATAIDEKLKREYYIYPQGSLRMRFTENHDKPRAADVFGPAHFAGAVLIFTMDGVPLIYSGQEIGETRKPSLFEKEAIDWKKGKKQAATVRKFYKELTELRREHISLSRGQRFRVNTSNNRQVFAFARSYRDDAVLVAINFSTKEFQGSLDVPEIFKSQKGELIVEPVFNDGQLQLKEGSKAHLALPPWGYQVWELK